MAMVSFDSFDLTDGVPIYLQIITYLKRGMIAGTVRHADELPSRRVLSARLGVNPNTVQKAYRMLEEEGLIESRTGAKSCIALTPETMRRVRDELLEHDARKIVSALAQMGLSKADALALIDKHWQ